MKKTTLAKLMEFLVPTKIDSDFEKELLRSEIFRTKILFWFFFIGAIFFSVQIFFIRQSFSDFLPKGDFPYWVPVFYFYTNSLYAYSLVRYFQRMLEEKRSVPSWIFYLSGTIESSIPTLSLLFFSLNYPTPILVFATPPEFVYFVFLILATLRLNERLAVFMGFVSFFEFNVLAFFLISITPRNGIDPLLLSPAVYVAKSNILLVSGFISAFVARQIKKAIRSTIESEKEKLQIRNLFGQHVSPEVVNRLLEQTGEGEGEMRHVCILFFDIRSFTSISESMEVKSLIQFLNQIFAQCIESVNLHQGIINKFLGDGFMAVFGAPISNGEDVQHAANCALDIKRRLANLKIENYFPPFDFGIGLHCGEAITGNIGTQDRKEYTVMGDVVNVASRIEQMNKSCGTKILVSADVVAFLEEERISFKGNYELKGKTREYPLFELK